MRVSPSITLGLFFALGVVALPERWVYDNATRIAESPVQRIFGRRVDPNARFKPFCQVDGKTTENWNKMAMGPLLQSQSDLFFDDGPCYDGPYGKFGDKTFVQALAGRLEGVSDYGECRMFHCEAPLIGEELCNTGENSMWLFFLFAIGNYVRWMSDLTEAIKDGIRAISDSTLAIATQFSIHAKTSRNWKNAVNIIIGGLIGAVSAALGPVIPILVTTSIGIVGGGVGIGVGLINSGINDGQAVKVQRQLDRAAALQETVDNWADAFNKTLNHWGSELVDYPPQPQNDPWNDEWYSIKEWSLPAILQSGDFATMNKKIDRNKFTGTMLKHFYAKAISLILREEGTVLIKLAGKVTAVGGSIKGCDFKSTIEDWGGQLYCKDNVAYFLTHDHELETQYKIYPPPGMDHLEHYGFTYEQVIDTSLTAWEKFGYSYDYDDGTLDDFNVKADHDPLFSIPLCDLDSMKAWPSWSLHKGMPIPYESPALRLFHIIGECSNLKDSKGNAFPYKLSGFPR